MIAAFGLAACAPNQLPPGVAGSAHTVGVVSALGNTIHFARSGMTVFGNGESDGDIADWGVDDIALAGVKSVLAPHYRVVTRKGDPELLQYAGERVGGPRDGELSRALAVAIGPNPEKADLWVTIAGTCPNVANYSGPIPCGVSVGRPEGLSVQPAWATLFARVTVFDGASLKPIAQTSLLIDGHSCYYLTTLSVISEGSLPGCNPAENLGVGYAVDSWSQYSAEQRATIRRAITEKLRPAVDFTFRQLKLVE